MSYAEVDVKTVCDALEEASARFGEMLRRVRDPSPNAIGVWSIGETAAHVDFGPRYFLAAARGELAEPEAIPDVAPNNIVRVATEPERDLVVLADRHDRGETELIAYARTAPGDPLTEPFDGVKVPLSSMLCVELGEVLVHGRDIARAAGLPWTIDRSHAAITATGFLPLLPYIVDPVRSLGRCLRCEITIRGGPSVELELRNEVMTVDVPVERPLDCRISADPAALLLVVFGRMSPWSAIATGRLLAWGRRPWRALSLQKAMMTV